MRQRASQHDRRIRQRSEALSKVDDARRASGRYVSRIGQLDATDAERAAAAEAHRLILRAEQIMHAAMTAEGDT